MKGTCEVLTSEMFGIMILRKRIKKQINWGEADEQIKDITLKNNMSQNRAYLIFWVRQKTIMKTIVCFSCGARGWA